MTGGMAYLYDPEGLARDSSTPRRWSCARSPQSHWEDQLKGLIERHLKETGSRRADDILSNWDREKRNFLQVCPREMLSALPHPIQAVQEPNAVPAE